MNFAEAKHLLSSGIPVVHSEYGRLFPLGNKESMFAKITSNKFAKFTLSNLDKEFVVNLEPNKANPKLVSLSFYHNTSGWNLYNHLEED